MQKITHIIKPNPNSLSPVELSFYVEDLLDRVISSLVTYYNQALGLSYSKRYWRILLEPWMYHYIIYHLYKFQQDGNRSCNYHEFLSNQKYNHDKKRAPCYDTLQSIEAFKNYNLLQQKSSIDVIKENIISMVNEKTNYFRAFYKYSKIIFNKIYDSFILKNCHTLIYRAGFDIYQQIRLTTSSKFKIARPSFLNIDIKRDFIINTDLRTKLKIKVFDSNDLFEQKLVSNLHDHIPAVFVEQYKYYRDIAIEKLSNYKKLSKIFTSSAHYYDEVFKFMAAEATEKGCSLHLTCHGGSAGVFDNLRLTKYESIISDMYYTFGWKNGDDKSKPMPATTLMRFRKKYKFRENKFKVLYCTTDIPKSTFSLPLEKNYFISYMNWQSQFLRVLNSDVLKDLVIRPHREDSGWSMKEHLQSAVGSKIVFETWEKPFTKSIQESLLYVGDHCSTTYSIALVMNIPTVLYWDPSYLVHTNHADIEIQKLKKVGIFHDTPESAAKHINNIIDDVYGWWLSDEVQRAKHSFCYNYARTDKNALKLWKNELLSNV